MDSTAENTAKGVRWLKQLIYSESKEPLPELARCLSYLAHCGCQLGWAEGEPLEKLELSPEDERQVARFARALPFQYYSEVFDTLVVPPEEPVVGDLADDVLDIYRDLIQALPVFEEGRIEEAESHWRFWFHMHWGEHVTSANRAIWAYLSGREGSEGGPYAT